MEHSYTVGGMTCKGCVAEVTQKLSEIPDVDQVVVDLENAVARITMNHTISLDVFKKAIPKKYSISEKIELASDVMATTVDGKSKLGQLKPLLLILTYITVASVLLHYKNWNSKEAMLDFMGLFYIVFSFFKLLDLKGFPDSFRMYDPLAKVVPGYALAYPFIELALGLLFLMRFQLTIALIMTLVVLGMTTIGVAKTLFDKKNIRCACLGTALKLPMTEATLIENTIMLVMAVLMLVHIISL